METYRSSVFGPEPVSFADQFSDDDFARETQEIAERNTFDLPEKEGEKSEEEKEYEEKEYGLVKELEKLSEKGTGYLLEASDEYIDTFKKSEDKRSEKVEESLGNLVDVSKNDGKKVLESLLRLVDLKYPSLFKKNQEALPNPFADEEKDEARKIEEAEDDFRRAVINKSGLVADNLEDLSKVFMADGNQNDYHVGHTLRSFGNGQVDTEAAFSNMLIKYLEEPTHDTEVMLNRAESDRNNLIINSLFNIAGAFDESQTNLGSKLFETTIALAAQLPQNNEDYHHKVMDYVKFKIENH